MHARIAKLDFNIYMYVFLLFLDGIGNGVYSLKQNERTCVAHAYTVYILFILNFLERVQMIKYKTVCRSHLVKLNRNDQKKKKKM